MENKKVGRRQKYQHFLMALEDKTVYSPGAIFAFATEKGLLTRDQLAELAQTRVRVRHTLAHLALSRGFPKDGDGLVKRPGLSITVGWTGARWKATLSAEDRRRAEDLLAQRTAPVHRCPDDGLGRAPTRG